MNKILIIRTFEKDDWLARLCYESWMNVGFKGKVIFYSENYETKWLNGLGEFIYHDPVDNFMGQLGVKCMFDVFRKIEFNATDLIIQCDADIVIKLNPLTKSILKSDIAGVGGAHQSYFHYNGECIIMSGFLVKKIIDINDVDFDKMIFKEMIGEIKSEVSDGHYFSYIAHKNKMKLIRCKNKWVHLKFYEHNGRTDFKRVITEIRKKYPNER